MLDPGPIRPVAKPGEYVLLVNRGHYDLYMIAYEDGIMPSFSTLINLGAINAGVTQAVSTSTQNILDMNDGHLGHFRAKVIDDIHVQISQPAGVNLHNTKNVWARLNAYDSILDPCGHLTEFAILDDDRVFLQATNPTGYNLAQSRVLFWGIKYVLVGKDKDGRVVVSQPQMSPIKRYTEITEAKEDAKKEGIAFTVVPIGGWNR